MRRAVLIDGELVAPEAATVSVYDRGFLYGDAVFEVVRTYGGGRPFALREHIARLRLSCDRVGMDPGVDDETLVDEFERGIAAGRDADGPAEAYLRLMVSRGVGALGLDPALAQRPRRVLLVEPLVPLPRALHEQGIAATTFASARPGDVTAGPGGTAKISNYLASILAVAEAKRRGSDEALFLDAEGRLREGAISNVFVVTGGRVTTPPLDAVILAGITRAHVLELLARAGAPVVEACPTIAEAVAADEIFVTSSVREVVPVVRLDDRTIGTGKPGPVAIRLLRELREKAAKSVRPE